jgi:hypothetical protein
MKIRHLISILVLVGVLSVGAFSQPTTGRITGVAVDPSDPSGNTVYVSTAGGGVWNIVTTMILLGIR